MSTQHIYSPEPFNNYLIKDSAENGEIMNTINFNRYNNESDIYVKILSGSGSVKPVLYRGYKDSGDNLRYETIIYPIFSIVADKEIILDYKVENDNNFINYSINFECVSSAGASLEIDTMGLLFDSIVGVSNQGKEYSLSLITDINNSPLYRQSYTKTVTFDLLVNSKNLEQIINVIKKPYYLVNILNDCIDNSTRELVALEVSAKYASSYPQYMDLTIKNIEEV